MGPTSLYEKLLMLLGLLLHLLAGPGAASVPPGEAAIRAAYAQYAGKWFRTATVIAKSTDVTNRRVETWYIAMDLPGRLRIDVGPSTTGRAEIYRGDSSFRYGAKELRSARPEINPMLLLTHGIHVLAPEKSIPLIRALGFDLTKTTTRMWEGQPVIVIGALGGDTTSNQFWLDKRRNVLVRMIHNAADPRTAFDAHVSQYQPAAGGWLERKVEYFTGGVPVRIDEYKKVRVGVTLEPDLFVTEVYHLPKWVDKADDLYGGVPNLALPKRGGRGNP